MTATENIVNVYFSAMHRFCWYCWAFLRYGSTVRIQWTKITIFNRYERKYLANGILTWPWLLLTINRKLHIVDLLYPDGPSSYTHCCRALTFPSTIGYLVYYRLTEELSRGSFVCLPDYKWINLYVHEVNLLIWWLCN